jgi:hypothetical protein
MQRSKRERHRTWKEPPELSRIRESFTERKTRAAFEKVYGRPPQSDAELEVWFELYTIQLYNNGYDAP